MATTCVEDHSLAGLFTTPYSTWDEKGPIASGALENWNVHESAEQRGQMHPSRADDQDGIPEDPLDRELIEAVDRALNSPKLGQTTARTWVLLFDTRDFPGTHDAFAPARKRLALRVSQGSQGVDAWCVLFVKLDGPLALLRPCWARQSLLQVLVWKASLSHGKHLVYLDTDAMPGSFWTASDLHDYATSVLGVQEAWVVSGTDIDRINGGWILIPDPGATDEAHQGGTEEEYQEWVVEQF